MFLRVLRANKRRICPNFRVPKVSPIRNFSGVPLKPPPVEVKETVRTLYSAVEPEPSSWPLLESLQASIPHSPVHYIQEILQYVHIQADLPWWLTIVGTTAAVRILFFPIVIKQTQNTARMTNARPELEKLNNWVAERRASGKFTMKDQKEFSHKAAAVYRKHNVDLVKMLLPFVQMPIFVSFFFACKGIAAKFPDVSTGGFSWFLDLSQPDPFWILPIVSSISMLVTLELGSMGQPASQLTNKMKFVFRGMMIFLVPATAHFPAAVHTYWVSSNMFSLIQTGFLKIPPVKRIFNIPDIVDQKALEEKERAMPKVEIVRPEKTFSSKPKNIRKYSTDARRPISLN